MAIPVCAMPGIRARLRLRLRLRASALTATAALALGMCAATPPAQAAPIPPPNQDPFYTYSGNLGALAPGTVLKKRSVDLVLVANLPTPIKAEQLLFRTTNQLGGPALAVTTVIRPLLGALLPPKIVSWQTFYDTLGPQCVPSYQLRGGAASLGPDALSSCNTGTQVETTLAATFLAQGDTVITTDYEETNEVYGAGPLEGYATLDGIRAAESYLHYSQPTTPVAMFGYSGGAIASQWAAELQPRYAPKLDLVGTAAGGVLVDPSHVLRYINGNGTAWAKVIPVFFHLLKRGFGVDIDRYLNDFGRRLVAKDRNAFINELADVPHLTYQKMLKARYVHFLRIPRIARIFNGLVMGSRGTPTSPIYLENGEGTTNNGFDGDSIMVTSDVKALARKYCARGVKVEYQQYNGASHEAAAVPFIATALVYLTARLNGLPAPSNC
jgi:pimeloyl-ACP methyl ester carboxylesterase